MQKDKDFFKDLIGHCSRFTQLNMTKPLQCRCSNPALLSGG